MSVCGASGRLRRHLPSAGAGPTRRGVRLPRHPGHMRSAGCDVCDVRRRAGATTSCVEPCPRTAPRRIPGGRPNVEDPGSGGRVGRGRAAPGQRQRHPRTGRSRCSTAASARPSGLRPGTALPGAARRTSPDPRPGCRDRRRRGRHDHTDRDPDLGDLGQHRQPADEQLVRHLDSGQHRPEPQHLRFRDRIPRRGPGNRQCRRRPGVSVHHLRQRPQQRAGAVPRR